MAKVPEGIVKMLMQLPENDAAKVCRALKLTDTKLFKESVARNGYSRTPCKDFFVGLFRSADKATLQGVYSSIEGVLFVGGCAPGVGIVFNLVDAGFCIALNNWMGAFIAIISCFPIPGFKVAGKGLGKLLTALLARISPADMARVFKRLGGRLSKLGYLAGDCYAKVGSKLEELLPDVYNPFAGETVRLLARAVKQMYRNGAAAKVPTQAPGKYGIAEKGRLLELTKKEISGYSVGR